MDDAFGQIIAGKNPVLRFQVGVGNFIQLKQLLRISDAGIFFVNLDQRLGPVHWFFLDGSGQYGYKQHGKSGQNRPAALSNDSPPGQKIGRLFHLCRTDRPKHRAALFRTNFARWRFSNLSA